MKHETSVQFKTAQQDPKSIGMIEAITAAKSAVTALTSLDIDSIAKCAQGDDGVWMICVDVVESHARMGDNDFLATYEVQINQSAELVNYNRLRRYHREDQDG